MRKRWYDTVARMSEDDLSHKSCCSKLRCFKASNKRFQRYKMELYLNVTFNRRKNTSTDMIGSNGCFLFDGLEVCGKFLHNAFIYCQKFPPRICYRRTKISEKCIGVETNG